MMIHILTFSLGCQGVRGGWVDTQDCRVVAGWAQPC